MLAMSGYELKQIQKLLRVKDAEVCAEAGIAINTLRRVYSDNPNVTQESVEKVKHALEILRERLRRSLDFKVAS
jgi:hypothetical protein